MQLLFTQKIKINKNKKQPDTLGKEGRAPYHGVQGEALTERGNFLKLEVYTL